MEEEEEMSGGDLSEADETSDDTEKSATYIHRDPDKRNMKKTVLVYGLPGPQVTPVWHQSSTAQHIVMAHALIATSVCDALLGNPQFHIRGILQRDNAEAIANLQEKGVETVVLKVGDKGPISVTKLKNIFTDAYGMFIVSNDAEPYHVMRREIEIGCRLAEMCERTLVKHVVYSNVDYIYRVTGQRCSRYDGKGEIEYYLRSLNVPLTTLRLPLSFSYLISTFTPVKESNDTVFYGTVDSELKFDGMNYGDVGQVVKLIFERPNIFIGKTIGLTAERISVDEYVKTLSSLRSTTVGEWRYEKLPMKEYQKDKRNNREFATILDFHTSYAPIRDPETTRALYPNVQTFSDYVKSNSTIINKIFKV